MRFGGTAATVALLPAVTACGEKRDESGTADQAAALRMKWWGGDARTKAYEAALAGYQQAHPSVTVAPEASGYDGYFRKLDSDLAGSQAADVIQMDTALVGEYAGLGMLLPLDTYVGNRIDLAGFPDTLLAAGKVGGKLYGVPSGTGAALVTFDTTLLTSIGATPPDAGWTWDGLRSYATKLTKALGGRAYGVADAGGDDQGAFQIFLRQRRMDLFTADGKLGYTAGELQEWFTYWHEMRKSGAAAPGEVTSEAQNDSSKNPLVTGRTAMTFGSGLEISLPPITEHDLDFVPVPDGPAGSAEGQYLSGGVLLSINAHSRFPDQSADLIGYFAAAETAITAMGLTRGIPPTEKARQIVAKALGPEQQRALAATNLVAERVTAANAVAPPAPPSGAGQVKELLFQNNLAVAFGRKTVPAAVESFLAGADSALA